MCCGQRTLQLLEHETGSRETIEAAMLCMNEIGYPLVTVSFVDFVELGALTPHEALREAGELQIVDTVEDLRLLLKPKS